MATAVGSTIGALKVVIGADTSGLTKGLNEAGVSTAKFNKTALVAAAGIAAIGAAALAAGAKMVSMARDEMKVIDAQAKLTRAIGGTVNGLRAFKLAAEDMGIDGVEASLNRFNRRMGAAEFGAGAAAVSVKALGLDLKALAGMDIQDRMAAIADTIQASGMSAQQAARHLQNMGFEQRGVAELFMQGGDAIRASTEALDKYGLAVSRLDAERIETINTSFTRISRVFDGIRTQVAVALAPAFERAAAVMETIAGAVASATPYIGAMVDIFISLADKIAIAAVATAAYFGPAIIAGIAKFTTSIAVGAVGAVKALTAAMLANPIGLIAAALVAAGYAAYKFRDQINEAIGVDVVKVAKTAANTVINSFVAAYEDIKFVWGNFGDMMGGAVVGGINVAIRAINGLIEGALSGINSLVDAINKIPGVDVGKIGDKAKIELLDNEYSARLVDAVKERNAKIAAIMSTDRFAGSEESGDGSGGKRRPSGGRFDNDDSAGGGGAAAKENDQLQQRLDNLREFLATREELEIQAGLDRVDIIAQAFDAGLISESDHNQMLFDLAGKFYESMATLRDEKYQEQRDKLAELNELDIISDEEYHALKMEMLAEQEQEKTDALIEAYLQRKEMLDAMVEEGDISEEEHRLAAQELEQAHQDELTRIAAQGEQERANALKKWGNVEMQMRGDVVRGAIQLLDQFAGKSKAAALASIVVSKGLAIAETIMATQAASMRALAELGPIAGAPVAAKITALGAAKVGIIAATGLGQAAGAMSGGGGGSLSGGASSSIGGYSSAPSGSVSESSPRENTSVTINLQGESYSRQQVRDLIEQINEATADGATLRLA